MNRWWVVCIEQREHQKGRDIHAEGRGRGARRGQSRGVFWGEMTAREGGTRRRQGGWKVHP